MYLSDFVHPNESMSIAEFSYKFVASHHKNKREK